MDSRDHNNWLVSKTLVSAFQATYKASEERALVLEIMTTLSILQPRYLPTLAPDIPSLMLREIKLGLDAPSIKKDTPPNGQYILLLAAALHSSPDWLERYWTETAEIMGRCIDTGDSMAVVRSLGVILDAIGG